MKMITKRGIFLWIMSLAFVVGLVFMTVSLVQNGDKPYVAIKLYKNQTTLDTLKQFIDSFEEIMKTKDGKKEKNTNA